MMGRTAAFGVAAALLASAATAQIAAPEAGPAATEPGPNSIDPRRFFVDTAVRDVRVSEDATIATMDALPASDCTGTIYRYERDRPKWLFQTGRLMQAQKEGARVRVSFNCLGGARRINAIQFLTPPPAAPATTLPRRAQRIPLGTATAPSPQGPARVRGPRVR